MLCLYCNTNQNNITNHLEQDDYCKNKAKLICFHCHKKTTKINEFNNLRICMKCEQDNEIYKCIPKTTAKSKYYLTDNDLTKLKSITKKNPYKSSSLMTLYQLSDILDIVDSKYEDFEKVKEEKNRLKLNRQQKLKENKLIKEKQIKLEQNQRRKDLKNELKKYKLSIRQDSKLCSEYIKNSLDNEWTLDKVVKMCIEMHWLYNYTKYKLKLDKKIKEHILKYNYYDYEYIEQKIRNNIIKKYGYPNVIPWL